MIWGKNSQSNKKKIVISITTSQVRLFLVENTAFSINLLTSHNETYQSLNNLNDICTLWIRENKAKGLNCYWLLSRDLYKTINIKQPKVSDSEIDGAIKWLVKDQVDQPLDNLLVTHYTPFSENPQQKQLTAVIAERELIEKLIEISEQVNLISIEIDELTASSTLMSQLKQQQITGFIDEDNKGLIYNFYIGKELAFTRHIKGRFFPTQSNQAFTLEEDNEAQTDQFLLETQRTLDYCVSQIFRKPVNSLIIDSSKVVNTNLVESLETVTELTVNIFELASTENKISPEQGDEAKDETPVSINLSIAEAGTVLRKPDKDNQLVNFYLPQYQPKPLEFGFKFAANITFLFVIGFIVYGYIQEQQQNSLNLQLAKQNKRLNEIQQSILDLNKNRKKKDPSNNLKRLIIKKQKELSASKKLLSRVEKKAPTKPISYSEVLAALAKQKADSLWLTKINLYPSSISLTGQTTKPKSIPNYINKIGSNKVLSSQFEELNIERDQENSQLVNFYMGSGHFNNVN